jgi:hypothetical protein
MKFLEVALTSRRTSCDRSLSAAMILSRRVRNFSNRITLLIEARSAGEKPIRHGPFFMAEDVGGNAFKYRFNTRHRVRRECDEKR